MHELKTLNLRRGLFEVKYYQHGKGAPLVYLHGAGGLAGFTPDLEMLAERFSVTAPLHPGFGTSGIEELHDDVLKFTLYAWDVLDALGIERPVLVGHSLGGMLAAEMAALEPGRVRKLVLVAPAGLYLEDCPTMDFFAMKPEELMAAAFYDTNSAAAQAFAALPADKAAAAEVMVQRLRGFSAAARFLWPLGDRGLSERLYRVKAPTLLMWGDSDKLIPPRYADAFKQLLESSPEVKIEKIPRAGHVVLGEQTEAAVRAIVNFVGA